MVPGLLWPDVGVFTVEVAVVGGGLDEVGGHHETRDVGYKLVTSWGEGKSGQNENKSVGGKTRVTRFLNYSAMFLSTL